MNENKKPELPEPDGWIFQHEESGMKTNLFNDRLNTPEFFMERNPRFALCGGLYSEAKLIAYGEARAQAAGVENIMRDAMRWRGLVAGRVRVIGSAGLHGETDPYGNPWNGYAHIGLELWTKHDCPENDPPHAVEWLTKYADVAALTAAPAPAEAKPAEGGGVTEEMVERALDAQAGGYVLRDLISASDKWARGLIRAALETALRGKGVGS